MYVFLIIFPLFCLYYVTLIITADVGSKNLVILEYLKIPFFDKLYKGSLGIPPPSRLSNSNEIVPFVIVGDKTFPLEILLPRFGGKQLADNKIILNMKLSKARRYIGQQMTNILPSYRR